jgi:hypothetical protein
MPKITLTPEQFQRIVQALADPNRYEMLTRIYASDEAITCGCAKGALAISDGTGSHHLHELMAADLICVAREGRNRMLTPRRDVWNAFLTKLQQL